MLRIIKNNYILIILLLLQFLMYMFYIYNSTSNIIFQDQFHFMGIIKKYFESSLSFADLWRGHLEHRTLGYNTIFLLNAIFFHLNTLIEACLGAVILLFTCILIYFSYHNSLNEILKNLYIQISFIVLISFVIFSLNQWENIVFSLGIAIMLKTLLFILSFFLLDRIIIGQKHYLPYLTISIILAILLFGGGYSLAFILSMLISFVFILILKRKIEPKQIKTFFWVLLTSISAITIYLYKIYDNNMINNNITMLDRLVFIVHNPLGAMKFLLLSFSSSVVGVNVANHYLSQSVILLLGLLVIYAYIYALIKYITSKMYDKTFMPIMLIAYSIFILLMILVGRLDYGVEYGMSSRYTTDTQCGIIGIIWIVVYSTMKLDLKQSKKYIALLLLLIILFGQLATNILEWRIASYRKANFDKLRVMALDIDQYDNNEIKMFQYDNDLVKEGIGILKKHNLNVFYDFKIGNTLNTAVLMEGWYSQEGNHRWIGRSAVVLIKSGPEGELTIEGYNPEQCNNNALAIYSGEKIICNKLLQAGNFKISKRVEKNSLVKLKIEVNKTFIPKDLNINNDIRQLGVVINSITIK